MATPVTTISEYCDVLGRSKLLPEGEVASLRARWQEDTDGSETDVDLFKKYLVQKRFLTDYQAALVGRGHADGFFIGGYVVQERIGKGQSAGVYKAVHTSGQVVALKVLPGSRAKEPAVLSRFQREGRLLTQLDHDNIVRAYQVGQAGSSHFIVMEHLDGETLDEVLARRKSLPPGEAVRLVHQALLGLQHLHDRRMVHRDLKPANLMVTPPPAPGKPDNTLDGTLKILDIGIGRELFDEESTLTQDMNLTTEGAILGTPDYLAPEQARDARGADVRADIYSAGCVLYHLIGGQTPFQDKNVMTQMVKHATEKAPSLSTLVKKLPAGLEAVVEKMMAKKPDDRYQTPDEAAKALSPFLPENAAKAAGAKVLPEFKQWLDTESSMDLPAQIKNLPLADPGPPAKKPGSGTHAAVKPDKGMPSGVIPRPAAAPAKSGMPSGVIPRPQAGAGASGIIPRPQAGAGASGIMARPPQSGASGKIAAGKSGKVAGDENLPVINVELIAVSEDDIAQTRIVRTPIDDDRPLHDLNRRDFTMLGIGAAGVLLAIGIGYGLAKGLKAAMGSIGDTPGTEPSTEPEPKPEPKPQPTDKGPKAKEKEKEKDKEPKDPK